LALAPRFLATRSQHCITLVTSGFDSNCWRRRRLPAADRQSVLVSSPFRALWPDVCSSEICVFCCLCPL